MEDACPLCCNKFTGSDEGFLPCKCGYKVNERCLRFGWGQLPKILLSVVSCRELYFPSLSGQVCVFCWHKIREEQNGLCPACRVPYPEEPFSFKRPEAADEDPALRKERLRKEKQDKKEVGA